MNADLVRASRRLLLPTLALAFVLGLLPGEAALATRIYALLLGGYALAFTMARLRRLPPARPLRPPVRRHAGAARKPPDTLARLEQEVLLGRFDPYHRLRPRLRALARDVLEARGGVSPESDPEAARRILGDATWELVRPDRPPAADRYAPGVPLSELTEVVESLERI